MQTVSDLAAFSVRQNAALGVCNEARRALVTMIDQHTAAVTPKRPWWKFR